MLPPRTSVLPRQDFLCSRRGCYRSRTPLSQHSSCYPSRFRPHKKVMARYATTSPALNLFVVRYTGSSFPLPTIRRNTSWSTSLSLGNSHEMCLLSFDVSPSAANHACTHSHHSHFIFCCNSCSNTIRTSSHETNSRPLTTCSVEELGLPMRDNFKTSCSKG
jgi:hypothetical protein